MNVRELEGVPVDVGDAQVQLGQQLGTGAEGAVYGVKGSTDWAVKIFAEEKRAEKAEKVGVMIENEPRDPTLTHRGVQSIVWPRDVVEDPAAASFLGYTMPYLDLSAHKNAQRYAREDLAWDASSPEERYITALNLALVVHAIHQQGHAMGDLNHQNVLIKDGYVSLIDCDGFHIRGEQDTYEGDTFFPRYTPPEGRASTLVDVRRGDLFGLGVHIFQLLMEGFHPYQAKGSEAVGGSFEDMIRENPFPYENPDPGKLEPNEWAPTYDQLPATLQTAFSDCFVLGRDRPSNRPTADDWVNTLRSVSGVAEKTASEAESTEPIESTDRSKQRGNVSAEKATTGQREPEMNTDSTSASMTTSSASNTNTATQSGTTSGVQRQGTTPSGQRHAKTSTGQRQSTSASRGRKTGGTGQTSTAGTIPRRTGSADSTGRGGSLARILEIGGSELVRLLYYLLGLFLVVFVGYALL